MSKLDDIIAQFTSDPGLTAQIQKTVADVMAKKQKPDVDAIIAQYTTDPDITAKVKDFIGKIGDGHNMSALTGYHLADANDASSSRDAALEFKGAVQHILASDDH